MDAYSRYKWERLGFDPSPCRDLLDDHDAYIQCVSKAFTRCRKRCSASCNPFLLRPLLSQSRNLSYGAVEPAEIRVGQVTVIERAATKR